MVVTRIAVIVTALVSRTRAWPHEGHQYHLVDALVGVAVILAKLDDPVAAFHFHASDDPPVLMQGPDAAYVRYSIESLPARHGTPLFLQRIRGERLRRHADLRPTYIDARVLPRAPHFG